MVKNFLLKEDKTDIICIIPARAGSKGIKNKNIIKVRNKELINYTIETAIKLKNYCDIVISTDSKKILSKCNHKKKLIINGLRPKRLSTSAALTKDVVKYELEKTENLLKKKYKYILLLQPTCPIRDHKKIIHSINLIKKKNIDSVLSISNVGANHPYRMKVINNKYLKNFMNFKKENMEPRQSLPEVYIRSGSIYLISKKSFLKYNSLVGKKCIGIELFGDEIINIDSQDDLDFLKFKLKC
jgi:CMP-N,N'-diacetyllegionaminic acid synthase